MRIDNRLVYATRQLLTLNKEVEPGNIPGKNLPGYKHPCRYCDEFIPPDSQVCPLCGKSNPLGPLRCVRCMSPVQGSWKKCNHCGLSLETTCPRCGKKTFLGSHCEHCDTSLLVVCPNRKCRAEQPPGGELCIKCGKKLK